MGPFVYGNMNNNHHLQTGFFVHRETRFTVKRLEFLINRTSYIDPIAKRSLA
jgi:hypothetical protein